MSCASIGDVSCSGFSAASCVSVSAPAFAGVSAAAFAGVGAVSLARAIEMVLARDSKKPGLVHCSYWLAALMGSQLSWAQSFCWLLQHSQPALQGLTGCHERPQLKPLAAAAQPVRSRCSAAICGTRFVHQKAGGQKLGLPSLASAVRVHASLAARAWARMHHQDLGLLATLKASPL